MAEINKNDYLEIMTKYSNEFKENAVRLSYQRPNMKELADELGINVERLYKWRSRSRHSAGGGFDPGSGAKPTSGVKAAEIEQLRRENQKLREENDILKKAVHIFSASGGVSISS